MVHRQRWPATITLLMIISLVLAACGGTPATPATAATIAVAGISLTDVSCSGAHGAAVSASGW